MAEAKAVLRYVRVAPRKARLVVDLIRGKQVGEALSALKFVRRGASKVVEKVLKSAIANAQHQEIGDVDDLWISKACVDGGPVMKRFQPAPQGRAHPIKKRSSHITLTLSVRESKRRDLSGTKKRK
jgi:large subunit ribosomal protein L22